MALFSAAASSPPHSSSAITWNMMKWLFVFITLTTFAGSVLLQLALISANDEAIALKSIIGALIALYSYANYVWIEREMFLAHEKKRDWFFDRAKVI